MKTFRLILLAVLSLILLQSCFMNGVTGSRNVTSESRTITQDFDRIDVSQGIDVYFTQDNEVSLTIELDDNLHELLVTEVKDGVLDIYFDSPVFKRKSSKVYVSGPRLYGVSASSGSSFESQNIIETGDINLDCSSGADIDINLVADNVDISSSSGSDVNVQGRCNYVSADSSSGSDIDASELESLEGKANASYGSDLTIFVTEKVTANASSGADISVKGHPKETNIDKSSGGDVSIF